KIVASELPMPAPNIVAIALVKSGAFSSHFIIQSGHETELRVKKSPRIRNPVKARSQSPILMVTSDGYALGDEGGGSVNSDFSRRVTVDIARCMITKNAVSRRTPRPALTNGI